MIEILSASAGSGKTFTLAKNYIYLLLQARRDREHFRHILAVTFTNKATDEMKSRILRDLYGLSTHPETSALAPYFLPGESCMSEEPVCPDTETLRKAAGDVLSAILHDYGSFSVSTIDKFFQRALKSFSRDAGHFTGYQIELDRDALIEKAVAHLLDGLSEEDKPLLEYLRRGAMDALENGRKMNLLKQLTEAASRLFGEEYRDALRGVTGTEGGPLDPEETGRLMRWARDFENAFIDKVRAGADQYLQMIEQAGLAPGDFSGGNRSFVFSLQNKYRSLRRGDKPEMPSATLLNKMADPEAWFAKTDKGAAAKRACLPEDRLVETATAFLRLFEQEYTRFLTVHAVRSGIWNLGVAGELKRAYEALTREKNLLTLEDSNTLLRGIIDGSDAPFVYERLGVRYEHFLLDEFQDTARVQWDNMLPLLLESQSHESRNGGAPYGLIVGDVKQSIYRWRGSDWKLMQEKAPDALRSASIPVKTDTLQENYRSLRAVVDFNNAFFRVLADGFDAELGRMEDRPVGRIYDEALFPQRLPAEKQGGPSGHVDIEFQSSPDAVSARVMDVIREWRSNGVRLGDIAILVRANSHGAGIAEYLMGHDPSIRIVSDDSLRIRSSEVVRRLVASLYGLLGKDVALQTFIAGKEAFDGHPAPGRSLMDVCQQLLRDEEPSLLSAHTLFIDAFLDLVQEYVEGNGNDLAGFLAFYEERDRSIASPEGSDAVRVITVHKSKGLQFPYVIYLNVHSSRELQFREGDRKWCRLSTDDPVLAPIAGRVYDLGLQSNHDLDLFRPVWEDEKCLKHIDVINTYYVAFTRPKYGLCILSDGKPDAKNVAGALYRFADDPANGFSRTEGEEGCVRFRFGEPYYAVSPAGKAEETFPMTFVSYPPGSRLRFSPDAADFFGEDGTVGVDASVRRLGTACHRILASVERPSDLAAAVESERLRGGLDAAQAAGALARLQEAVAFGVANGLFPEGAQVLNEQPLMDSDGTVLRPDRVIINGGRVTVVDYKFGAEDSRYFSQIRRYARAFRDMGYAQVDAFLWYVNEDKLLPLQNN